MSAVNADASANDSALENLPFSDLYIRVDQKAPSRYRIGPNPEGRTGNVEVPPEHEFEIDILRTQIDRSTNGEGTLNHDSMRLRFSVAYIAGGERWASIRRIPLDIPRLETLRLANEAISTIQSWGRRRGIVLVGGATGAGKTTTVAAILQYYLESLGGTAVSIEDPPEYLLQGAIGENGACYQMELQGDDWASAVKTALRWRPRFIFLGEIRTPEAARQALRASTSGHLVLTTIHGGSIDETVGAMISLNAIGQGDEARNLLADNIVGVIHQRLGKYGPAQEILSVVGQDAGGMRQLIRNNQLSQLARYAVEYVQPTGQNRR